MITIHSRAPSISAEVLSPAGKRFTIVGIAVDLPESTMPSAHPPRSRRPVRLAAVLLGLVGLLGSVGVAGSAGLPGGPLVAEAAPYASAPGDPTLTLPSSPDFVLGRAGTSYVIEADGDPLPAIGVDRLPPGLRLVVHGDGSATVEGTPTGPAGSTTVAVTAQNASGSTTEPLTVTVQQGPVFLDRGPLSFVAGEFTSLTVRAAGFPAPGLAAEGDLPAGLGFTDNGDGTATIAGTPVEGPAQSPVTLTAVNVVSDVALTTTVRVIVRPDVVGGPVTTDHPTGPQRAP